MKKYTITCDGCGKDITDSTIYKIAFGFEDDGAVKTDEARSDTEQSKDFCSDCIADLYIYVNSFKRLASFREVEAPISLEEPDVEQIEEEEPSDIDKEKIKMLELRRSGKSKAEIARIMGISYNKVYTFITKHEREAE